MATPESSPRPSAALPSGYSQWEPHEDRITSSGVLVRSACLLVAIYDEGGAGATTLDVYNAQEVNSERLKCQFRTPAGEDKVVYFRPPLRLDRGLYFTMGGGDRDILVVWEGQQE